MPMLHEVAEKFCKKNLNPHVSINCDVSKEKFKIHSDYGRLREIIENFMSNALKFTDRGSISITFEHLDNGHVRISVSDTGKGIPEEAHDRIFDRFFKLDEFVQGAGLGLSVCRSYAFSLSGTVGVRSRVGEGSTFWVEIPAVL